MMLGLKGKEEVFCNSCSEKLVSSEFVSGKCVFCEFGFSFLYNPVK